MIIILTIAILKQIITQIKEIAKRTVQVTENIIKEASHSKLFQNIKDFHRTTLLAITIATNTTNRTNCSGQAQMNNRNIQNSPGTQKLNDEYDESYQSLTSRTHSYYNNWYDQLQRSFYKFYAKTEHGNGNTQTQNPK